MLELKIIGSESAYPHCGMQSARSAITALGIALALVAMPASAGWYYQNSAPSGDTATPGVLEDDPIDLLEELKQVDNDLSPTDLGNETPQLGELPVLLSIQSDTVNERLQITQVPEPATLSLVAMALIGIGLAGLAFSRRKRS